MMSLADFDPCWRGRYPVSHRKRCVNQFIANRGRQDNFVKQSGKNIDMPNQDQIIDRTRVGDDELHPSKPQAF